MDKETNAELFNKVAIINKETKKKPHNITIKNNNTCPCFFITVQHKSIQRWNPSLKFLTRYKEHTHPQHSQMTHAL